MAEYIEREAFIEQKRKQYCEDCTRRKGMRNGKYKTLYEIGEAPCRACEIDDVLNDVEDFPAADVRPVVLCRDCKHNMANIPDIQDGINSNENWNACQLTELYDSVKPDDFCSRGVKKGET